MKNLWKIFLMVVVLIFAGHTCLAQSSVAQVDTVKSNQNKVESSSASKNMNTRGDPNRLQGNNQQSGGTQAIKQVKGARPDMTKARGARPAYIERPAGSGIPRGIGKPGGAIKPGKR